VRRPFYRADIYAEIWGMSRANQVKHRGRALQADRMMYTGKVRQYPEGIVAVKMGR
jgi:hypothetical protein